MNAESGKEGRTVRVSAIQLPPASDDKEANLETIRRLVAEAGRFEPDFILMNELATTPYFGGHQDARHLAWAETVPGKSTEVVGEMAKALQATILLPLCEQAGELYYNSVAVISPEGDLISGTCPDGTATPCFRKPHLADVEAAGLRESFYFAPGEGLPVFETPKARIGILVCYDRCFPEAWRTLALQGAKVIFVPSCIPAWYPEREEQTLWELRTRALENQLFVAATNRAGTEELDGKATPYFGHAVILGPAGNTLAEGPSMEEGVIGATLDLGLIAEGRAKLPFLQARRPEVYHLDAGVKTPVL
ncbi:MAG: carbon-nitrogen hydrolase family protein [Nitrospinota bacterium]|jgi:predicted amidohydrolase|nr:carbon-nitrogen hydrolase family protein [Nitrospinota bacterium]MDP7387138.1 carbon-nitrogen hydrolase family protein [Nitrospinota bacterium]